MKNLLTIAGSDSGGGAGIQADIKTFAALGTYGMSVITAVTAQNTTGVRAVAEMDASMVKAQIDAVFEDIRVDAVKIGMVSNVDIIKQISDSLTGWKAKNIVVDPVMVSKSGHHLIQPNAREALIKYLLPLATVVTPNLFEAEVILNRTLAAIEDLKSAAKDIYGLGPKNVLIKGGHLEGAPVDILFNGIHTMEFTATRQNNKNTHGTGCTLSAAIAAHLALGRTVADAVKESKEYITEAIEHGLDIGKGVGPVHHFYRLYKKARII